MNEQRNCENCGVPLPQFAYQTCTWECSIELAKKQGCTVHTPNGLPIRCITANGMLLEHEHGDHPSYRFPIDVEWTGTKPRFPPDPELPDVDEEHETHALIYSDGSVALTLYECSYSIWSLNDGHALGGFNARDKWRIVPESLTKVRALHPGLWP